MSLHVLNVCLFLAEEMGIDVNEPGALEKAEMEGRLKHEEKTM